MNRDSNFFINVLLIIASLALVFTSNWKVNELSESNKQLRQENISLRQETTQNERYIRFLESQNAMLMDK